MNKVLLRIREVSELTGIGKTRCYCLVNSGIWPSVRVGRTIFVPVKGLEAWIEARQEAGSVLGLRDASRQR